MLGWIGTFGTTCGFSGGRTVAPSSWRTGFCTVIVGVITPGGDGFGVELATGGHPPALLISADGQARYVDTVGGQVIGTLAEPRFVSAQV